MNYYIRVYLRYNISKLHSKMYSLTNVGTHNMQIQILQLKIYCKIYFFEHGYLQLYLHFISQGSII